MHSRCCAGLNSRGSSTLLKIERAFWIIFALAFLGTGLAAMLRNRTVISSADTTAYSSTDAMLRQTLGVKRGSAPVVSLVSQLPPARPLVLIVNRRDNDSILTALTLSYLAWPHLLFVSYIEPEDIATTMNSLHQLSLAGVFFYALSPPKMDRSRSLGSKLIFAPSF